MSDKVERYTRLKAAADDIKLKRAGAEARRQDAEKALADIVAEVKEMGYNSVAELKTAIEITEAELNVLLEDAEAKLKAGGYA